VTVLAAGQKIDDRYLLERRIAVGGMGEVWEASDTRLGRGVAVKVLRPELGDDPEFLHRFRIEARTVASLDNPGIAAVHDYGEDEGPNGRRTAYLVMELVRGEPLSTVISRGPIDADETLRLIEDAAWALQAAHERGFVHRDVKPGNILVRTDGVVKLTDFGIAKAADAVPVTRSGMVMGTAHYIAPEQASGAEAGPASDVYSLGIVGYECLAGHRPFRADSAVAVAMMQVREAPPPLPASVPAGARELIEATLVKDPTQRYATGGEFALAVAAVRRGEPLPPLGSVTGTIAPPRTPSTPSRAAPRAAPPSAPFPAPPSSPRSSPLSAPIPTRSTPPRQARPVPAPPKSAPQVARPAPVPARRPAPDTRRNRRPQPAPAARHAAAGPSARRASSQSFRLQPKSSGRTLLLVLFVLLTLAAVAVGVLLFRGGVPPIGTVNPTPQGAGPGTVAGQEGVSTSSAVPGGLLSLVIVTGSVR
jgi:eukaryotic-like serine/threonine-protein kinase